MKKLLLILLIAATLVPAAWAKTEKFGTWIELGVSKKFLKKFEFSIIPELRLQDDFTLDEYIFEGRLEYEALKYLSFATSYRHSTNIKNSGNEISQYLLLDISGKTVYKRFDGSLRLRLTNDSDGGDLQWESYFFRPRLKIGYNIKNWKTDPYISYEAYYDFKNDYFYKGRFDMGVTRKIGKPHEISVYYRLQDYYGAKSSVNILGISYGFKF